MRRIAVDLTDEDYRKFMLYATLAGYRQATSFFRYLIRRIGADIEAETHGFRVCYKRGDEIMLVAPLTGGTTDAEKG